MKQIAVYSGKGVSPDSYRCLCKSLKRGGLPFKRVTAEELKREGWESGVSLLALPGGQDVPYHEALKGEANRRIRAFVEEGGGYFGICAGAYYGCGSVLFEEGGPLEVVGTRELGFFPGPAQGPAYGNGQFRYYSASGARLAYLSRGEEAPFALYYNGGCAFSEPEGHREVEVEARYLDLPGRPAAILSCKVGEGRAVLSGVHPEFSFADFPTGSRQLCRIKRCLLPFEERRQMLFATLISSALANPKVW